MFFAAAIIAKKRWMFCRKAAAPSGCVPHWAMRRWIIGWRARGRNKVIAKGVCKRSLKESQIVWSLIKWGNLGVKQKGAKTIERREEQNQETNKEISIGRMLRDKKKAAEKAILQAYRRFYLSTWSYRISMSTIYSITNLKRKTYLLRALLILQPMFLWWFAKKNSSHNSRLCTGALAWSNLNLNTNLINWSADGCSRH